MPAWLSWLQRVFAHAMDLQGSILALCIFFSLIYIYNKGITLNLNTFISILIKSLRIPCGMVHGIGIWKFHGIHMESTWTGPWNP